MSDQPAAFPYTKDGLDFPGMTLRDYFAAQMVAPLALDCHKRDKQLPPDQFAYECYRFARAMLHERSKP